MSLMISGLGGSLPRQRFGISSVAAERDAAPADGRLAEAAREFEAMMIERLLKSARDAGRLFESEEKMTGGEGYLELAEQELARVLAARGTFGLARLLVDATAKGTGAENRADG